jgi:hypothetical protein
MNAAPNIPKPPALETAATSGGKDTQDMAPWMIGCFIPKSSVIRVFIISSSLYLQNIGLSVNQLGYTLEANSLSLTKKAVGGNFHGLKIN